MGKIFSEAKGVTSAYNKLVKNILSARYLDNEVEWLLENFYVIEGALSDIRQGVRRSELKKLPSVLDRKNTPLARVYVLLSKLLKTTENEINAEILGTFLRRYQKDVPLSIRELDLLPIVLKLVLVTHMRDLIIRMSDQAEEYAYAEMILSEILKEVDRSDAPSYSKLITRLSSHYKTLSPRLGLHLIEELTKYSSKTRPIIKWFKLHFSKQGVNIKDLGEVVGAQKNKSLTAAAHIVDGLRWISQVRWNDFLKEIDPIEKILSRDPAGAYALMTDQGKGEYRRKIVRLADRTGIADTEVARIVVRSARTSLAAKKDKTLPQAHVGYYLVDAGVPLLEEQVQYVPTFFERSHRFILANAPFLYLVLGAFLVWAAYVLLFPAVFFVSGEASFVAYVVLGFSVIVLLTEMVLAFITIAITTTLPIKRVFSLDLHAGVGRERSTFVVVPSMMRDTRSTQKLLTRLETTYVGNEDPHVLYALLLDFQDAPSEVMPYDDEMVRSVQKGIDALNAKYASHEKVFYFFYRKRIWNSGEGVYMGWERKRGKLREFNRLLRGSRETSYVLGTEVAIPDVRYIVTIDEDTEVPREAVTRLIGAMSHPLNRPVIDERKGKVQRGYGVIQPRVSTRMASAGKTLFSRLFSSAVGIDSYSGPSADVYQDLFGEGLFFGKGIYDIDVVERMMGEHIPENLILSHDLLEGLYARTGYASDIQLFDGFPSSFIEFEMRNHRWIRGDWQIIGWLGKRGSHFNVIAKWKIFDNIRRNMVPITSVIMLLYAFHLGSRASIAATILVVSVFGLSSLVGILIGLFSGLRSGLGKTAIGLCLRGIGRTVVRVAAQMTFLLYDAYISFHAVIVSLLRMTLTHKRLLQWNISYDVARRRKDTIAAYVFTMAPATTIAAALLFLYVFLPTRQGASPTAFAVLWIGIWLVSFVIAFVMSATQDRSPSLTQKDRTFLRKIAYRGVRYFTDFSVEKNNYLIPDHYQVDVQYSGFVPGTITSSTNIGMMLVSFFSAYRLGLFGLEEFAERLSLSFRTLSGLERYKGHLYNWYDIHKLVPVGSKYVSAADSANFIIGVVALRRGLIELLDEPVIDVKRRREGLADAITAIVDDVRVAIAGRIPRTLKQEVYKIGERAAEALADIEQSSGESYTSFIALLSELEKYNISIQGAVGKLRLQTDHEKIVSIYASTEYFERLVAQGKRDIDLFLSFHLVAETMSGSYKHWSGDPELAPLCKTIAEMAKNPATIHNIVHYCSGSVLSNMSVDMAIERSTLSSEEKYLAKHFFSSIATSASHACENGERFTAKITQLIETCDALIAESDFSFLYNKERGLFHIGYNVAYDAVDNAYYDFLASESNLISFIASVKGQSKMKQWFNLGRRTIQLPGGGGNALVSWGGSLFEYLTPLIFLKAPEGSILQEAGKRAIRSQMRYARLKRMPWGMGESACSRKNAVGDYHYQIFGDPSLGFRRGLDTQLVVAPYTTAMAIPYSIGSAIANFKHLIKDRAWGVYGFYDAVEYTDGHRYFRRRKGTVAEIYYAHHLGFTVASLLNVLQDDIMRTLFHSDPRVMASDFLLEEAYPISAPLVRTSRSVHVPKKEPSRAAFEERQQREFIPSLPPVPRYAFLSNGSFSTIIDSSGGGWSTYEGDLITRRTSDQTVAPVGTFIYMKNTRTGEVLSVPYLPTSIRKGSSKVVFFEDSVEFSRRYGAIETRMNVSVHPQEPVELRTVTISNKGDSEESIDLISYGEIVLATPAQDAHHPLFHKLFVKTDVETEPGSIFFERRTATNEKGSVFAVHTAIDHDNTDPAQVNAVTREGFVGREGTLASPATLRSNVQQRSAGEVDTLYTLDPICSLKKNVVVPAGGTATVTFLTAASARREDLKDIVQKYKKQLRRRKIPFPERRPADPLASLGITPYYARIFRRLLSGIVSGEYIARDPHAMKVEEPIVRTLWKNGISGDLPLFVVRISGIAEMSLLRSVLLFWRYARFKGIDMDVVLLNEHPTSYNRAFEDDIDTLINHVSEERNPQQKGGIFHLKVSLMEKTEPAVIEAFAHATLRGEDGTLEKQVRAMGMRKPDLPKKFIPTAPAERDRNDLVRPKGLFADNGIGGFDQKTGEYVMYMKKNTRTPVPWTNVIATEQFGTIVSNSGASYTWSEDSYDNRLTAWYNDPLLEKSGEAFYLRDEESGEVWSPTPFPIRSPRAYTVRHGAGYSVFEYVYGSIHTVFTTFIPKDRTIKIGHFFIENRSAKKRTISLTAYVEPVLGALREHSQARISVERDETTGSLIARNDFRNHFCDRFMFLDVGSDACTYTADRREFLGPCGDLAAPASLARRSFSDSLHTNDPCIALKRQFVLDPHERIECTVLIGEAKSKTEMHAYITEYDDASHVHEALEEIRTYWKDVSGKIAFETPDKHLDMIANHWLVYQNLSSRLFGKTGYYQPSGAYGFRDQLQDVAALAWTEPERLRAHIIEAAGHQFQEGDALNWWHVHNDFGLRSLVSDHHLWLPWAVLRYSKVTGDRSILDRTAPFLSAPVPNFVERQWTGVPNRSNEEATIYEHCIRAFNKSLTFGAHGLPLIGAGDWNDGLNHVGDTGKGESVWLAWFLLSLLTDFISIAEERNDTSRITRFKEVREQLLAALEKHAWDGKWYRRAFLDNGAPLGSAANQEYCIDSVAQSFAVLGGVAAPEQARIAMDSVGEKLFVDGLLKLIDPPIDRTTMDIGYIAAYPPGVRENGAQYNHAALWSAQAFATLGNEEMLEKILAGVDPAARSDKKEKVLRYRTEPYVVASDIYASPSYAGRGGWTWYTGSAGVLYRTLIEYIFGLRVAENRCFVEPTLPASWPEAKMVYRYKSSVYQIDIKRARSMKKKEGSSDRVLTFDGEIMEDGGFPLVDDGKTHMVAVDLLKMKTSRRKERQQDGEKEKE